MNYTMEELIEKILQIFEENRCSTLGKEELEEQEIFFEGLKKNKNGMDQGDGYFFCKDGVLEANICYAGGEFYLDLYDFRNGTSRMTQSDWDEMEREKEWKLVQIQKLQKEIDLMENMLETQRLRRLFRK
jgi:hypothetical protein